MNLRQLNRGGQTLRENDIKNMRKLFNRHHYVVTTAELLEAKLYYADIRNASLKGSKEVTIIGLTTKEKVNL